MLCLFAIMLVLVLKSLLMDGAKEALKFNLYHDFGKLMESVLFNNIFSAISALDGDGISISQWIKEYSKSEL